MYSGLGSGVGRRGGGGCKRRRIVFNTNLSIMFDGLIYERRGIRDEQVACRIV